jgi:hypothetical protein
VTRRAISAWPYGQVMRACPVQMPAGLAAEAAGSGARKPDAAAAPAAAPAAGLTGFGSRPSPVAQSAERAIASNAASLTVPPKRAPRAPQSLSREQLNQPVFSAGDYGDSTTKAGSLLILYQCIRTRSLHPPFWPATPS